MKATARGKRNRKKWNSAPPRTIEQLSRLDPRTQDVWDSVAHVVSKMRSEGVSLHEACRDYEVDPRTVIRWGGAALRKLPNGKYAAKSRDTLLRVLSIPTEDGLRELAVRDSRLAVKLAKYWAAVQEYLRTGKAAALRKFQGVQITSAEGNRIPLITDLRELERLGNAGVLAFESLYARTA